MLFIYQISGSLFYLDCSLALVPMFSRAISLLDSIILGGQMMRHKSAVPNKLPTSVASSRLCSTSEESHFHLRETNRIGSHIVTDRAEGPIHRMPKTITRVGLYSE